MAGTQAPAGSTFTPPLHRPAPQSKASWYERLARGAASWGWAVAQYDLPRFPLVDVQPEVELFPALLKVWWCIGWVRRAARLCWRVVREHRARAPCPELACRRNRLHARARARLAPAAPPVP